MKVVIFGAVHQEFLRELQAEFPTVTFVSAASPEEQVRQIVDAEAFYGVPCRQAFLVARRLRWVHFPGTGIDWISQVPELVKSDVVLTNARGPHAPPMADHVFAVILTFAHRLRELWEDQRARRWEPAKYAGKMQELAGATMGILALGDIGMAVARRAHGFGMEVYAVTRRPRSAPYGVKEVWGPERLDDLLRISDWLVVTAPLTDETRGLLDGHRLSLLKPTAYLIVVSRGGIVDEEALAEALRARRIAGAALDVMAQEPLPQDSPLWGLDNVLLSPHVSALTPEMYHGRKEVFKENLRRYLAGRPFLYVCDKEAGY